jgi:hypothetical protein
MNCGTDKGYRAHLKAKEPTCDPRKMARNERHRQYVNRGEPAITTTELAEEIRFLLNAGEGEMAILKATGYQNRPKTLHERLRRNGHTDLNQRMFPQEVTA